MSSDIEEVKRGFNKLAQQALKIPTVGTIQNAFAKKFKDAGFDVYCGGSLFEIKAQKGYVAVTGNKNGTFCVNYNGVTTPNERSLTQTSDELADFYAKYKDAPAPSHNGRYTGGDWYHDGNTM